MAHSLPNAVEFLSRLAAQTPSRQVPTALFGRIEQENQKSPKLPPRRSSTATQKSLSKRSAALNEGPLPPNRSLDDASGPLLNTEIKRRVSKVVTLVQRAGKLVPYDPISFSLPLVIWKTIRDIPVEHRLKLLDKLSSNDMEMLWLIAGERHKAHPQDIQTTLGPDFSLWDDFPDEAGKVAVFEGKAAVPLMNRFRKLFFLHPKTYELYGHVDVGKLLGPILYPLYFKCSIEEALFPGTIDLTDMQLDYLPLDKLGLCKADLPHGGSNLPAPGEARWPFTGGLRDYMRSLGPGVFIGRGWKQPSGSSDPRKGSDFLYFLLVRKPDSQR